MKNNQSKRVVSLFVFILVLTAVIGWITWISPIQKTEFPTITIDKSSLKNSLPLIPLDEKVNPASQAAALASVQKLADPQQAQANANEQREKNPVSPEQVSRNSKELMANLNRIKSEQAGKPAAGIKGLARGFGQTVTNPDQQKAIDVMLAKLGEDSELHMDNLSGTLRYLDGDLNKLVADSQAFQDAKSRNDYAGMTYALAQELSPVMRIENPGQEFVAKSTQTDELGMTHVVMQQTYQNAPIWGAQVGAHFDAQGNPVQVSGVYAPTPSYIPTDKPEITSDQALTFARDSVPASNELAPAQVERMVYWDIDRAGVMSFRVQLTTDWDESWEIFVNAQNGQVIHKHNQVCSQASVGQGADLNGVSQTINCWLTDGKYYAVDTSKPMYDSTSQPPSLKKTRGAIFIMDVNQENLDKGNVPILDITTSNINNWDPAAISVMHHFGMVEDYYRRTHTRNSIDANGMNIVGIIHARFNQGDSVGSDNAFWNPGMQMMVFGDGSSSFRNLPSSLDVAGHELTHGVIDHSAKLIYENQSGALNEHLADFFGAMVDRNNWLLGEGITVGKDGLRDMQNPANTRILSPQPTKFSEYNNLPNTDRGDWGGVHVNSGIPNRMTYLLCDGPQGIGRDKAEKIIYRALTVYMTQRTQFSGYREAVLSAAKDLHGENSAEWNAVKSAFDGVEITESQQTPSDPTPGTPVSGEEQAVFLIADPQTQDEIRFTPYSQLAINIQGQNYLVTDKLVASTRPAVTGDGKQILYVGADNDVYLTDGTTDNQITTDGITRSIAMSKDGRFIAYTTIDYVNVIYVLDTVAGLEGTAVLEFPQTNGEAEALEYADILTFNFRGDSLVYDALSEVALNSGEKIPVWGIYALRIVDLASKKLVSQTPGDEIGNPIFSNTSDHILIADYILADQGQVSANLLILDILKGEGFVVQNLVSGSEEQRDFIPFFLGQPSFRGDDHHALFRYVDPSTLSHTLISQQLSDDNTSFVGGPEAIYSTADPLFYPVGFRVGAYQQQKADISVPASLAFGTVQVNQVSQKILTVANQGDADLEITAIALEGPGSGSYSHNGINQVIAAGQSLTVNVDFHPSAAGDQSAVLKISSTDYDESEVSVTLQGAGQGTTQADTPTPSRTPISLLPTSTPTLAQAPTSTPTIPPVINPSPTPQPGGSGADAVYEFDQADLAANGWANIPGGFTNPKVPGGLIGFGQLNDFGNPVPSSKDQKGMKIRVAPTQVEFVYALQPVQTGGKPVLLRATVNSDSAGVTVVLGALKGQVSTGAGLDGSIATHMPVSAASFFNKERQLTLVYEPDSGEVITPLIQVAAGQTPGNVTVLIDKLEVFVLDPAKQYTGGMFDSIANN